MKLFQKTIIVLAIISIFLIASSQDVLGESDDVAYGGQNYHVPYANVYIQSAPYSLDWDEEMECVMDWTVHEDDSCGTWIKIEMWGPTEEYFVLDTDYDVDTIMVYGPCDESGTLEVQIPRPYNYAQYLVLYPLNQGVVHYEVHVEVHVSGNMAEDTDVIALKWNPLQQ